MPLNILHLGKYLPTHLGGIEYITRIMANAAAAGGANVTVVGVEGPVGARVPVDSRVKLVPFTSRIRIGPVALTPGYFALREYLAKADVVHIHMPNPLAELALLHHVMTGKRQKGQRIIPIAHAGIQRWYPLGRVWEAIFERPVYAASDRIFASARRNFDAFEVLRPHAAKAWVVPFPTAAPLGAAAIPDKKIPFRLVSVGRLVHYKGFDVLLRAVASLDEQIPWQLAIVGNGPLRDELRHLARSLGIEGRVEFKGTVSEEEKARLLHGCDLYVHAAINRAETYGVAIAEAFSYQKPVVLTALPTGVAYLARGGSCGAEVAPSDPQALATAIAKMARDENLRARCARDNFNFWRTTLTEEAFSRSYLDGLGVAIPEDFASERATSGALAG